jgi:hypothetical protein
MHAPNEFPDILATYLPNTTTEKISEIIQLLEHKILYGQEKLASKMMTN